MTLTEDDLQAAVARLHRRFVAGLPLASEDLKAAALWLARVNEGCRCDPAALRTSIQRPDDGDPRPIVRIAGHALGCPCHPGPGRPPGLRLAA